VPTTLVTPYSYPMGHPSYSFVSKNGQKGLKQAYYDIHLHNLLFQTQICSRGQLVVLNYCSVSPKVPTTLVTPYSYPMGHPSYSFVSKNGQKGLKQAYDNIYLHNLLFHTQICSRGQLVVLNYRSVSLYS
jgi:hypothetical protein